MKKSPVIPQKKEAKPPTKSTVQRTAAAPTAPARKRMVVSQPIPSRTLTVKPTAQQLKILRSRFDVKRPLNIRATGSIRRAGELDDRPPERMPLVGTVEGPKGVGLSTVAFNYAHALANGFGHFDELPCVPVTPAQETQKWRSLFRTTFSTGSGGCGFVMYKPLNPANNVNSVITTTSNWSGAAYTRTLVPGPPVQVGGSLRIALPYPSADFATDGNFLQARLVSSTIRIRNYTNALKIGGLVYATRLATGESLDLFTTAQLAQSPLTVVKGQMVDGQSDWMTMAWMPGDADDIQFPFANANYGDGAGGDSDKYSMGFFAISSDTTVNMVFEVEIMEFWEFTGQYSAQSIPETTLSPDDPVGLARVLTSACSLPNTLSADEIAADMSAGIVESMAHSDTVAKTVEDLLGLAGMAIGPITKLAEALFGALLF